MSELNAWLDQTINLEKNKYAVNPDKAIRLAAENIFDINDAEESKNRKKLWKDSLAFTRTCVPGGGKKHLPWWDILFALKLVADSYDVVEHDINRYEGHSYKLASLYISELHRKRDLLNTATDLWKSLKVGSSLQRQKRSESHPNRILLVDDNPLGIRDEITAVVRTLMPGYELWCWNPTQDESTFTYISLYNSMTGAKPASETIKDLHLKKQKTGLWNWDDVNKKIIEREHKYLLEDILKQSCFVLVDLLFKFHGREDEFCPALIRGLHRFCVDRLASAEGGPCSLPYFIAFSRSDDLEKIQKALLAGASGYVLKHRLMSLPAVLARLRAGTGQDETQLHRNFQALDFLPNETRGLLHEIKITRKSVDRNNDLQADHHIKAEQRVTPDKHQAIQNMASLLRAIPKTDLHLHAGSCMTPEYLVVASLVMLAERCDVSGKKRKQDNEVLGTMPSLFRFWSGDARLVIPNGNSEGYEFDLKKAQSGSIDPVAKLGSIIRRDLKAILKKQIRAKQKMEEGDKKGGTTDNSRLRSILHEKLGIRDHWSESRACDELDKKDAVTLMLFALNIGEIKLAHEKDVLLDDLDKSDILRLFILFMAAQYDKGKILFKKDRKNILNIFDILKILSKTHTTQRTMGQLNSVFKDIHKWSNEYSIKEKEGNYVELEMPLAFEISLAPPNKELLRDCPTFKESPLEYLIATGTRGRTLAEYLAGCEYAGAEHLQRACLMRLYARQTLEYLVRHGVLYAELRAAVSGYASKGHLTYQEACNIFQRSFSEEQKAMMDGYRAAREEAAKKKHTKAKTEGWLWCSNISGRESMWKKLFSHEPNCSVMDRYFPAKVNLIFTGKRHKATREMVMEAAAGVMLSSEPGNKAITANDFTQENMESCRFVGFDLAGPEEAFPPEMFRNQFEQLSHMHIPITAHAGENASAQFVESAVLDLRARRLGHGLALADDPKLMGRVREERICIELCPVSNYQTNEFVEEESGKPGRIYPLKNFMDNGNIVCLNTDNPIVSYTNIVKEFFQASYAYGKPGLSLWDALRMIRMGFAHAFKSLAERRALLELVEQMIFDLMIDPEVEKQLRDQAAAATE